LHQVTLPYTYRIARYPVTNAEYRRFIEAGGYQERRWWTEQGWAYSRRQSWIEPRLWKDERFNQPTQPVVGVSWYEAVAYCAWLTEAGRVAGWLPATDAIRLPTSLEWERAVRGTDQRRYPWGDEAPNAERANYKDTGIGRPTPVGCFPAGEAACGALDGAGNVWEWLATPYAEPELVDARKDFTTSEWVLMKSSAWATEVANLCCGARDWSGPDDWCNFRSFRIIRFRALAE
jgi:formylglycine-generating enzyme required for sulfatase activity